MPADTAPSPPAPVGRPWERPVDARRRQDRRGALGVDGHVRPSAHAAELSRGTRSAIPRMAEGGTPRSAERIAHETLFARNTLGRACGVLLGAVTVMTIDARQTPTPSSPSVAAQQGQPAPAGPAGLTRAGRFAGPEARSSASPTSRRFPARRGASTTRRGRIRGRHAGRDARRAARRRHRALRRQGSVEVGAVAATARSSTRSGRSVTATSRPAPGRGSIVTRDKFGDVQLHVEFATPSPGGAPARTAATAA